MYRNKDPVRKGQEGVLTNICSATLTGCNTGSTTVELVVQSSGNACRKCRYRRSSPIQMWVIKVSSVYLGETKVCTSDRGFGFNFGAHLRPPLVPEGVPSDRVTRSHNGATSRVLSDSPLDHHLLKSLTGAQIELLFSTVERPCILVSQVYYLWT